MRYHTAFVSSHSMSSRSIHVFAMGILFFFLMVIVNIAAICLFCKMVLFCFGYILSSGIAGLYGSLINLLVDLRTVLHGD